MESRNKITAKQLGMYVLSAQVGLGFITLPSILANEVGHDGWVSILAAGIISSITIVLIMLLLKRYSDKSIFEISQYLFGKFAGKAINYFLILYLGFLTVMGLRLFTEFIKLYTLELTPGIIVSLLIIAPTAYLTWYGLKPLSRFSNILIFVLFVILVLALLILNKARLTFLMPVGSVNLTSLIKSLGLTFFAYIGFELVTIIYPYVADKENALKWVVTANLSSMIFYLIIFLVGIGLFGGNMLKTQLAPLFELSRYYRMPYIERVDLLFILLWYPLLESTFRSYFFSTYDSIRRMIKFNNKKVFFLIFMIIMILLSRIPSDLVQVFQLSTIINYGGITVTGFLIICYFFSFINKRGVKTA